MTPQACSLLVRAGVMITDPRESPGIIRDAALCIDGDRIVAVGHHAELAAAFRPQQVLGGSDAVVMPGLVNAHDHGRAPSALQLGVEDDLLEAWLVDLLRLPAVDARDAVRYAALEQLESGITTTSNSFFVPANYRAELEAAAAAYRAVGLRVALVASSLDQSPVAALMAAVAPQLKPPQRQFVAEFLAHRRPPDLTDFLTTLDDYPAFTADMRQWLIAGPVSVHWCSDALLDRIWSSAARRGLPLQTHLLESAYQAATAMARHGHSIVHFMHQRRLLQPNLSCAHCVYLTASDMALLAAVGVSVIHNAGSNLRLRNGTAPIEQMMAAGINVALGLDSQGISDDADMWQEMRLVARVHQQSERAISGRQILAMATVNGAKALGMEQVTGTLTVGKKADVLMLNRRARSNRCLPLCNPEHDAEQVFERVALLGDKQAVSAVIVNGDVLMREGFHTALDKQQIGSRLRDGLAEHRASIRPHFGDHIAAIKPVLRRHIISFST